MYLGRLESERKSKPINGNKSVWRYMDHHKFEKLLETGLWFSNAKKFTDKYELSFPEAVIKRKREEFEKEGLEGKEVDQKLAAHFYERGLQNEDVLVNCWSVNRYESYALWKIYINESGKDDKQRGVAIKTTAGKLRRAIENGKDPYPEEFFMEEVEYRTYLAEEDTTKGNLVITKRPFYKYEDELRLFIFAEKPEGSGAGLPYELAEGRNVRVDTSLLISEIFLSPFSAPSYRAEVERLAGNNGLGEVPVKDSKILDV